MKTKKIHVVIFTTGLYEDRIHRTYKAYTTKSKAQKAVEKATEQGNKVVEFARINNYYRFDDEVKEMVRHVCTIDPKFEFDHAFGYYIVTIDLL